MHAKVILQIILGAIITLATCGVTFMVLQEDLPTGNRELIIFLLGNLNSAFLVIINFVFGSSLGSQSKDAMVRTAQLSIRPATATTPATASTTTKETP